MLFRRIGLVLTAMSLTGLAACATTSQAREATTTPSLSSQKAQALENNKRYAECMREEGFNMPDPVVESDGEIGFGGKMNWQDPKFRTANKACEAKGVQLTPPGDNTAWPGHGGGDH
ncbi:hypothetical protein AB0J35_34975 [Nonomuraea angiospora]|uniref:hypothetical protein n=1 Tax=Nonomuraea angiospora TaxID=46172 RepID=UPI00341BA1E3